MENVQQFARILFSVYLVFLLRPSGGYDTIDILWDPSSVLMLLEEGFGDGHFFLARHKPVVLRYYN